MDKPENRFKAFVRNMNDPSIQCAIEKKHIMEQQKPVVKEERVKRKQTLRGRKESEQRAKEKAAAALAEEERLKALQTAMMKKRQSKPTLKD